MDCIIFSGQSNMQGQSERLTENQPVPKAYEYKFLTDKIVPLRNPVGEDITVEKTAGYPFLHKTDPRSWLSIHVAGSACYGHTNLVPSFCRAYTEETCREVLAIHVAKGSTSITQWLPESAGYEIIVKKTLAALKKARESHSVERCFFVWLQGESDAINGMSKDDYKRNLRLLRNTLKDSVGIQTFGIIRVGRFTNDIRDLEIISSQDEICAEADDFTMLTTIATDLNTQEEYMNPFVKGHYSAKGLERLGWEAGKGLGQFAKASPF